MLHPEQVQEHHLVQSLIARLAQGRAHGGQAHPQIAVHQAVHQAVHGVLGRAGQGALEAQVEADLAGQGIGADHPQGLEGPQGPLPALVGLELAVLGQRRHPQAATQPAAVGPGDGPRQGAAGEHVGHGGGQGGHVVQQGHRAGPRGGQIVGGGHDRFVEVVGHRRGRRQIGVQPVAARGVVGVQGLQQPSRVQLAHALDVLDWIPGLHPQDLAVQGVALSREQHPPRGVGQLEDALGQILTGRLQRRGVSPREAHEHLEPTLPQLRQELALEAGQGLAAQRTEGRAQVLAHRGQGLELVPDHRAGHRQHRDGPHQPASSMR